MSAGKVWAPLTKVQIWVLANLYFLPDSLHAPKKLCSGAINDGTSTNDTTELGKRNFLDVKLQQHSRKRKHTGPGGPRPKHARVHDDQDDEEMITHKRKMLRKCGAILRCSVHSSPPHSTPEMVGPAGSATATASANLLGEAGATSATATTTSTAAMAGVTWVFFSNILCCWHQLTIETPGGHCSSA